jgi:hypothetical protein
LVLLGSTREPYQVCFNSLASALYEALKDRVRVLRLRSGC